MTESNDFKWVICTPAKTGSYSIEKTLIGKLNVAHKYKANDRVGTFYNGKAKQRILVVRHPLEKWASMYWFIRQVHGNGRSIFLGYHSSSPDVFADSWLYHVREQPHENYTSSYSDMAVKFKPTEIFKLEHLKSHLDDLLRIDVPLLHSNRTHFKRDWKETSKMLNIRQRNAIEDWAKKDLKQFGYDL